MTRTAFLAAALSLPLFVAGAHAQEIEAPPAPGAAISVYANGLSVVTEHRAAVAPGGPVAVALPDLPVGLDIDTLTVRVGAESAGTVSARRDVLSQESLLRRSLGREIVWLVPVGDSGAEREIRGTLVGYQGGLVLRVGDRYEAMPPGRLALDALPPGMIGGLEVFAAAAPPAGETPVVARYTVPNLAWSASYEAALPPDAETLTLTGHYRLTNETDTDFEAARLRLVAGEVNRVAPQPVMMERAAPAAMATMALDAAPAPPRAASLGDVHVYDLADPIDLPAHQSVKRVLIGPVSVPVEKHYRLTGTGLAQNGGRLGPVEGLRPSVSLTFENAADGPLGTALPAGIVRVLGGLAGDGGDAPAVILGEDGISHLPVGGTAEIALGLAFDVTASRRITDFEFTGGGSNRHQRPYRVVHEIRLKNGRSEAVVVDLRERFHGAPFEIRDASIAPESRDGESAHWKIDIPANGETTLTYTARVTP
jgi:hypothetical protein